VSKLFVQRETVKRRILPGCVLLLFWFCTGIGHTYSLPEYCGGTCPFFMASPPKVDYSETFNKLIMKFTHYRPAREPP